MIPKIRKKIGPDVRVIMIEPTRFPTPFDDMKIVQNIEK